MDKEERAKYDCIKDKENLEKCLTDDSVYAHEEMKQWLQENFNDNCSSLMEKSK